jgi:CrcB protein
MLMNCLLVALGGSIGAVSRYGVSILALRLFGNGFPIGTLLVNLSGCFLIGLFFALAEQKLISSNMRIFFITGFLGALTTFSAFAFESVFAMRDGMHITAMINLILNNFIGLLLVIAGIWFASLIK